MPHPWADQWPSPQGWRVYQMFDQVALPRLPAGLLQRFRSLLFRSHPPEFQRPADLSPPVRWLLDHHSRRSKRLPDRMDLFVPRAGEVQVDHLRP